MENREILVANTKTQKRSKIITSATTLGELKDAFDDAGIDYAGMTFTEGISKTQLIDDDTQLPHDIMYKGQPTNNLVILLTNTKKNIASGAMSRSEAYQAIKAGNLQDAVKSRFGRNFTQVPTTDLIDFLNNHASQPDNSQEASVDDVQDNAPSTDNTDSHEDNGYDEEGGGGNYSLADCIKDARVESPSGALFASIAMLAMNKALTVSDVKELKDSLDLIIRAMEKEEKVHHTPVSTSDGSINDDDIDNMISSLA